MSRPPLLGILHEHKENVTIIRDADYMLLDLPVHYCKWYFVRNWVDPKPDSQIRLSQLQSD